MIWSISDLISESRDVGRGIRNFCRLLIDWTNTEMDNSCCWRRLNNNRLLLIFHDEQQMRWQESRDENDDVRQLAWAEANNNSTNPYLQIYCLSIVMHRSQLTSSSALVSGGWWWWRWWDCCYFFSDVNSLRPQSQLNSGHSSSSLLYRIESRGWAELSWGGFGRSFWTGTGDTNSTDRSPRWQRQRWWWWWARDRSSSLISRRESDFIRRSRGDSSCRTGSPTNRPPSKYID